LGVNLCPRPGGLGKNTIKSSPFTRAIAREKIARAKHNGEELSFFAKRVGSDYSLNDRWLFCVYKKGFAALAAGAGAASAIPNDPNSPFLVVYI